MIFGKTELANYVGVSAANISKMIRNNRLVVDENGKIDSTNAINSAYISKKEAQKKAEEPLLYSDHAEERADIPQNEVQGNKFLSFAADIAAMSEEEAKETLELIYTTSPEKAHKVQQYRNTKMMADEKMMKIERERNNLFDRFVINKFFDIIRNLNTNIIEFPDIIIDDLFDLFKSNPNNCRPEGISLMKETLVMLFAKAEEDIKKEIENYPLERSIDGD